MILNFGDYIFDDGIRGINGGKSKIEKVIPSSTVMRGSTPVVQQGNMDIYQQYAFNEDYYNKLLNHGKLQDAVDYISRYRPVDANKRAIFDADVASLRQQAKYEDNFRANLNEDQLNRYNFYNGVFEDRGLDAMNDNPYVKKFNDIKRNIGSVTTFDKNGNLVVEKEATGLSFYFPSTKRLAAFLPKDDILADALARDTGAGLDNFLEYSNLSKDDLKNAGVEIRYDKQGSAYLSFSKANGLANSLIYKYIDFYSNHWDDGKMRPAIQGLDKDGNVITQGIIPFNHEDNQSAGVRFIKQLAGDYIPSNNDIKFKNDFNTFKSIIDENKDISLALEKAAGLTEHDYSSIESNFISDAMQNYLNSAAAQGFTQEQIMSGMKYIHAQDVEMATKSISQNDKDFYTSFYNKEDGFDENDDTLVKQEDPDRIKELIRMLNEANPDDVNLTTLVSNGVIGTKISIQAKEPKKGDAGSGRRGVQIWVPKLFMEEAQRTLNTDPKSRAALEVNTILDTNSSFNLRNGARISADSNDQFYLESGKINDSGQVSYLNQIPISKEEAATEITKDFLIDNAIQEQMNEQIAPSGNVISIVDYEAQAKQRAADIAQRLYPGVDTLKKTDGTLITPEEIFNKELNLNNVSPYVYTKIKTIYDVYDALMSELYSYEGFQDALLEMGKIRYNYSINA